MANPVGEGSRGVPADRARSVDGSRSPDASGVAGRALRSLRIGGGPLIVMCVLLLLALVGASIYSQVRFREIHEFVKQADEAEAVLREVRAVLITVLDAESGQRGFLLTGRPEFLQPYEQALAPLEEHLNALDRLVHRPEHRAGVEELARLARRRLERLAGTIAARPDGLTAGAELTAELARGKQTMDELRALIARLDSGTQQLLGSRRERASAARQAVTTIRNLGLLSAILGLGVVAVANSHMRRSVRDLARVHSTTIDILETMGDAFLFVDREWIMTYLNARARSYFGPENPHLIGRSLWEALPRVQDSALGQKFRESARTGKRFEFETDSPTFPGRWIEVRLNPSPAGLAVFFRDMTERRKMQQQIAQMSRMESIGRLAGGVAHDFNNLLTAIIGFVELASSEVPEGHAAREHLKNIRKAGDRATELTRQLLAFARRQIIEPRVVDLNALIADSRTLLERLVGEDVHVRVYLAADLWRVQADPTQLLQVLLNLAANARDAMPDGGHLTIETANATVDAAYAGRHAGTAPGDYVMLTVSDTGVGMEAAVAQHVFEPFFTTKDKGKGTGLGLASCYGIIKQAGGHIWLYSEPGRGTTFKIYLPRVDKTVSQTPSAEAAGQTAAGTETVLLVEDEPMVRAVAVQALRSGGYTVLEASSGEDALSLVEQYVAPIHLLVTDVVLPGITGKQLAERLKVLRPGVRVLYCSGYAENAIVRHGVLDEGLAFLAKPYAATQLARKVREVLDRPQ